MQIKKIEQKIISILRDSSRPLQLNRISKLIGISAQSRNYGFLKKALENLCQEKIVVKSSRRRYSLQSFINESIVTGTLKIYHGRGLVYNKEKKFPITIKRKNLHTAFEGDKVLVKLLGTKKNGRQYGEIIDVIHRAEHLVVGTIEFDANLYFFVPDDERYYVDFLIPPNKIHQAGHNDKVRVRLLSWEDPHKSPIGEVVEVLGTTGNLSFETDKIFYDFGLPKTFPTDVINEVSSIPETIPRSEIRRRLDLRKKLIITIDPADAKDFDDAVSLETLPNGNELLGVHIADVSYYVSERCAVDQEAFRRGTSIYLVDQVIPMLPEKLSSDLCSLKPNRNRLAFSVLIEFDKNLNIVNYQILETIIRSKKRLNYDEVYDFLKSGRKPNSEIEDLLYRLNVFTQRLREKRFKKGGINFETFEVKFVLDENRNPIDSFLKESNLATQLIEECMLVANKTVAEHIQKLSKTRFKKGLLPFIYRVHEEPEPEKINSVLSFLKYLGVEAKNLTSSRSINNFLNKFDGKPEKPIVHQMLIRAMQKAIYSNENFGHFGLGFRYYTHFTSPIRRYPDLIVHRLLKLYQSNNLDKINVRQIEQFVDIASHQSTDREIVAMEAERESIKLMQTIYATKHIGKSFYGTISGVTNYGFYVFLNDLKAEGMVSVKDLIDDYYIFDEQSLRLVGRRKNRVFKFGDRVYVRIVDTNIERRKITLKVID
ncbi:MAG: ribonuclease R [Candidatus Kapaibacteriales bacterium]